MKANYEENAQRMCVNAKAALLLSTSANWQRAKALVEEAARCEIRAINLMRDIGIALQEARQRERISFEWFNGDRGKGLAGACDSLPASVTFRALKFCVSLARSFSRPVTSLDEARHARQMMFEAFGQSQPPRRAKKQKGHDRNPWSAFVSGASSLSALVATLEAEPLDLWSPQKRDTFLRTIAPIVRKHDLVRRLGSNSETVHSVE